MKNYLKKSWLIGCLAGVILGVVVGLAAVLTGLIYATIEEFATVSLFFSLLLGVVGLIIGSKKPWAIGLLIGFFSGFFYELVINWGYQGCSRGAILMVVGLRTGIPLGLIGTIIGYLFGKLRK